MSPAAAKTQFSPKTKKIPTKKREAAREEGLMDYLNNPSHQEADQMPPTTLPSDSVRLLQREREREREILID